jgi:ADP-ribosyl-[dinitrogen reductase] hydrolase
MASGQRHHPSLVRQRAIGAFVGAAVGDALGAGFEFDGPGLYTKRFPQPVLAAAGEMRGGGSFDWSPGEFTDDTAMAVALAESLVAHRGLDHADAWLRWRAWARTAPDVGNLTRIALSHDSYVGSAGRAAAINGGHAAGNGSLMRNVPVALFHHDDSDDDLASLASAQSALTHHDPDCAIACALHARMVRAAMHGDDAFAVLDESIADLPGEARARWSALLAPAWEPAHATKPNGTVWTCFAQAAWAVRGARDFAHALARAIDLGDDTDTVACVTGSIAGAIWGIQGIPSRWTTYVHGTIDTPNGRRTYRSRRAKRSLARCACTTRCRSTPPTGPERATCPTRGPSSPRAAPAATSTATPCAARSSWSTSTATPTTTTRARRCWTPSTRSTPCLRMPPTATSSCTATPGAAARGSS